MPAIVSPPEEWAALDQLPQVVRDVLQRAPDPYECGAARPTPWSRSADQVKHLVVPLVQQTAGGSLTG